MNGGVSHPERKTPTEAPILGGKPRSAAQAQASRINGRAGGVKGGRPRAVKYLEDFEQVGEPPEAPLALARWIQRLLAVDLYRQITGRANIEHSRSLRATASAASKMMPLDVLFEAQRLVVGDAQELDADGGPATEPFPEDGTT